MFKFKKIHIDKFIKYFYNKGKGYAEMAVSRHRAPNSGFSSSNSLPSTPMSESFSEEFVNFIQSLPYSCDYIYFFIFSYKLKVQIII